MIGEELRPGKCGVIITYKNWKGVKSTRTVTPIESSLRFAPTKWHPEPQWVIDAWDHEKESVRTFAMKDITSWSGVTMSQLDAAIDKLESALGDDDES